MHNSNGKSNGTASSASLPRSSIWSKSAVALGRANFLRGESPSSGSPLSVVSSLLRTHFSLIHCA